MNQIERASIYRICAVSEERWDVLRGASDEPVATFQDKHAALAYAMCLAREASGLELPLTRRQAALRNVLTLAPRSRGPGL